MAVLFERLASAVGAQKKAKQATILLGAAANLRDVMGASLRISDQPRYQQILAIAHAELDKSTYACAYTEGYAMTLDQAIVFALAQA